MSEKGCAVNKRGEMFKRKGRIKGDEAHNIIN